MLLKVSSLLILSLSLGMISHAEAAAMKCEHIFVPTVNSVLEQINKDTNGFLFKDKNVQEYQQNLSWSKRRQLRRLIHDIQFEKMPSEFAVEQTAIKIGNLLFGKKEILDNYILKKSEARLNHTTTLLLKEQLLTEGFLKTWTDYKDPSSVSRTARFMDKIWKFQHSKVMGVIALPYFLPKIKDRNIPHELVFKVIRDGMPAHKEQIRVAMNAQNYVQGYNTFRRLYTPVVMSVLLIVLLQDAQENYDQMVAEQVDQMIEELRQQKQILEATLPEIKKEEAQAAYERVLIDFAAKWGEPPTPEEDRKIRSDINKALGILN